jgi:hypothetical protein
MRVDVEIRTTGHRGRRARGLTVVAGLVLAVGGIAACGADGTPDPSDGGTATGAPATPAPGGTPPTAPAPTPEGPAVTLVQIRITGGVVDPPPDRITVERGATVRIEVTGDRADELHLHGYEVTADLEPGRTAVIELVADQAGLFELETHASHLVLLQLAVR